MPAAEWTKTSDTLILHGRRICKPKPLCDRCMVRDDCDYYRALGPKIAPKASKAGPKGAKGPRLTAVTPLRRKS
jgi:adenine-specific DNA glycosylase